MNVIIWGRILSLITWLICAFVLSGLGAVLWRIAFDWKKLTDKSEGGTS